MKKVFRIYVILMILSAFWINTSYADGPVRKLGRGLANTATGWIELFTTMKQGCEEHGYIAGGLYGFPVGVGKAALRTAAGIYEALTFPVPLPKHYEPIIEPEFVTGEGPSLEKME